ncbi:MAG: WxL domain-containing protein [Thermomicrobiales bacterium]
MFRFMRQSIFGFLVLGALVIGSTAVGATGATSSLSLTAGTLGITSPPANFGYTGSLTGDVLTLTSSFAVSVSDSSGTGAGWNLQAQIGTLTSGTNTIPAANHSISGVSVSGVKGVGPSNSVVTGQIPTTMGKIFNAAANSGMGQATMAFNTQLTVPASALAGTYNTTMTVSIVSGP